jgi:hypothetical protein
MYPEAIGIFFTGHVDLGYFEERMTMTSASMEPEEQSPSPPAATDLSQPSMLTTGGESMFVPPAQLKSEGPDYVRQEIDYTVKTKPPFQAFAVIVFLVVICIALFVARMSPAPTATPSATPASSNPVHP